MSKKPFMMDIREEIANKKDAAKVADNETESHLQESALLKALLEYSDHPDGGDPRAIGVPHDNEQKAENAKHTEWAFAGLTAILAVIFSFLSYYIPMPWPMALLLLIVICGVLAFGLTIGLRKALIKVFRVDGKNKKAVKQLWLLFTISLTVFVISLVACLLARYAAVGPVELVGIEQMLVEVSGLLCAASAGAVQHHYEDIAKLVAKIQNLLRNLGHIETQQVFLQANLGSDGSRRTNRLSNGSNGNGGTPAPKADLVPADTDNEVVK